MAIWVLIVTGVIEGIIVLACLALIYLVFANLEDHEVRFLIGMLIPFIGAIPAALLRWVILRRPLSLWPAIGISFLILIGLVALWDAMGGKSQTPVGAATAISFTILWAGRTQKSRRTSNGQSAVPPPLPPQPAHLSSSGGALAEKLKAALGRQDCPPVLPSAIPPPVPQQHQPLSTDVERRLTELKALFDKGLITESDYSLKKTEILAQV
jgi:hypothetical protein